MKRTLYIIAAVLFAAAGCTKVEKAATSGTETIDNTIYSGTTYYTYGFSFSTGNLVATTKNPGPDITVFVNSDNVPSRLTLQADNLKPSFFKVGEFADEAAAKLVFDNLLTVSAGTWVDMADPLLPNQVWVYRSGSDRYAKIKIISTINEIRQSVVYGECTFQWVYQPDGSLTFPGK
jgi:hypothetical protein